MVREITSIFAKETDSKPSVMLRADQQWLKFPLMKINYQLLMTSCPAKTLAGVDSGQVRIFTGRRIKLRKEVIR